MKHSYTTDELLLYIKGELGYDESMKLEDDLDQDELLVNQLEGVRTLYEKYGDDGVDKHLNSSFEMLREGLDNVGSGGKEKVSSDAPKVVPFKRETSNKEKNNYGFIKWVSAAAAAAVVLFFVFGNKSPEEELLAKAEQLLERSPEGVLKADVRSEDNLLTWEKAYAEGDFKLAKSELEKLDEPNAREKASLAYLNLQVDPPNLDRAYDLFIETSSEVQPVIRDQMLLYAGGIAIRLNHYEEADSIFNEVKNQPAAADFLDLLRKMK